MASVLFTVVIAAVLVFWFGATYRRIVHLRIQVSHAWKRLDELVRQRLEIVVKTVELARNAGMAGAELDRLARASSPATLYRGPAEAGSRNVEIDGALAQVISLMGQHSGVGGALRAISDDLNAVNSAVVGAGRSYNTLAASYNRAIDAVPGNLIAGITGFHRAETF